MIKKKGQGTEKIVMLAAAISIALIVIIFLSYTIGGKINPLLGVLFGFNFTKTPVASNEMIRYQLTSDNVQFYDKDRWVELNPVKDRIGTKIVERESLKRAFENYYLMQDARFPLGRNEEVISFQGGESRLVLRKPAVFWADSFNGQLTRAYIKFLYSSKDLGNRELILTADDKLYSLSFDSGLLNSFAEVITNTGVKNTNLVEAGTLVMGSDGKVSVVINGANNVQLPASSRDSLANLKILIDGDKIGRASCRERV